MRPVILICAMALALSACGKKAGNGDNEAAGNATDNALAAVAAPAVTNETAPAATPAAFDVNSVPVSTVPLGDFPYITLPQGYTTERRTTVDKDFARFPFWVNGQAHWVEGRFHGGEFVPVEGKGMSEYEVRKNFEALIQQMGGQKISEEKIPYDTVKSWGDEINMGFNGALGDVYSQPATTFLIRRGDGNIWVHLVTNSAQGWYLVGQEKAFVPTAQLLPASALKQQLDSAGKVAIQVNFATDKTDVLPDSLPQIDQVVQLLKGDPALKLAVNGHTDNSGNAAHNQQLSEGRAKAVMALLVARGIAPARLSAKGFGQGQPVSDNGTEAGKAKNRRVELVKQG